MWNYIKLRREGSPMEEILSQCSDKANLRLVIYHLGENHVECATMNPNEVRGLALGSVANAIAKDAQNGPHAILAYDMRSNDVYLIDSTPELPVASAVLLCVVTELLNGNVQPRANVCGRPNITDPCRESLPPFDDYDDGDGYPVEAKEWAKAFLDKLTDPCSITRGEVVARRAPNGRFCRREDVSDEPWKNPPAPTMGDANDVIQHRFRLGRH